MSEYRVWYDRRHTKAEEALWLALADKTCALIFKYVGFNPQSFLDIGCGSGRYLLKLTYGTNYSGIGIDPEKRSLMQAKSKIRASNAQADIAVSIGENVPVATETMEFVLCSFVLDHVANPTKVLSEAKRILKPNGLLFVLQGLTHRYREMHLRSYQRKSVDELLASNGFNIIRRFGMGCSLLMSPTKQADSLEKNDNPILRSILFINLYLSLGTMMPKYATIYLVIARKEFSNQQMRHQLLPN